MIYFASPYTSDDLDIEKVRYMNVCLKMAELINKGYAIFSPIAMYHGVSVYGNLNKDYSNLSKDFETWKRINHYFLSLCNELWILMLEGWEDSEGIKQEIEWAKELQLPIHYIKE